MAEVMPVVVKVIVEDDCVGVVADSYVNAENAKQKIKVTWELNKKWDDFDVEEAIKVGKGHPIEIQKEGSAEKLLEDGAEGLIQSEYFSPIGAHAQIEPNGCLAFVEEGKITIKMSTQVAEITRKEVAKRMGMDKDEVIIKPTFLGGGFGRRLHTPNAIQAAVMSKAVGKPVKCFFTRKEEFQNDSFRPPTHNVLKGKLTADGKIEAISHDISSGDVMHGSPLLPGILQNIIRADLGASPVGLIHSTAIPTYRARRCRSATFCRR